jgi:hypothetical protein
MDNISEQKIPLTEYLQSIGSEGITGEGQFKELVGRVVEEPLDFIDHLETIAQLLLASAEKPELIPTSRIESAMVKLHAQTLTPKSLAKIFPGIDPDRLQDNPDFKAYTQLEKQLRAIREKRLGK